MIQQFNISQDLVDDCTSLEVAVILHKKRGYPIYGVYECGSPIGSEAIHYLVVRYGYLIDAMGVWHSTDEVAEFWTKKRSICYEVRPAVFSADVLVDVMSHLEL